MLTLAVGKRDSNGTELKAPHCNQSHLGGLGSAQAPLIITRTIKSPTSSLASSTAPVYLYRHIYIYN
jgi:hypothetical protein